MSTSRWQGPCSISSSVSHPGLASPPSPWLGVRGGESRCSPAPPPGRGRPLPCTDLRLDQVPWPDWFPGGRKVHPSTCPTGREPEVAGRQHPDSTAADAAHGVNQRREASQRTSPDLLGAGEARQDQVQKDWRQQAWHPALPPLLWCLWKQAERT